MVETWECPECGRPSEVQWRAVMESTDGPIEHVRIQCVGRHWFLLPVSWLDRRSRARARARATGHERASAILARPDR